MQALSSVEVGDPEEIMVAAVVDRDGARVLSRALLQRLNPTEHALIKSEVERVLLREFPCLGLTPLAPWRRLLNEGARDPENQMLAHALGTSVDHGFTGLTERPDRYFGVSLNQLIDCHWFAFWEARKAVTVKA